MSQLRVTRNSAGVIGGARPAVSARDLPTEARFPGGLAEASVQLRDLARYAPGSRSAYGIVTVHAVQLAHKSPALHVASVRVFDSKGKLVDTTHRPQVNSAGGSQENERFLGVRIPINKLIRGHKYTVVVEAIVNGSQVSIRAQEE